MSLHDDRKEYRANSLSDEEKSADPVALFSEWLESYRQTGVADATAFALSTVSSDCHPDARIVLLKALEQGRMQFFTHYTSKKGRDLAANPFAHALFFWPSQERQVRVFGPVSRVDSAWSTQYFNSRPAESRRGAIASDQSAPIESRAALDGQFQALQATPDAALQRPEGWGGYALEIQRIEFWQGRPSRMHDRLVFTKQDAAWHVQRLQP